MKLAVSLMNHRRATYFQLYTTLSATQHYSIMNRDTLLINW